MWTRSKRDPDTLVVRVGTADVDEMVKARRREGWRLIATDVTSAGPHLVFRKGE